MSRRCAQSFFRANSRSSKEGASSEQNAGPKLAFHIVASGLADGQSPVDRASAKERVERFCFKGARCKMSDAQDEEFVLPQLYKRHVFACFTQRPPNHPRGSCGASGAQPLWDRLGKLVEADGSSEIGFTAAGCMGFCSAGPLMVVYPEGVWYRPTTPEDVDEIYSSHLKEGRRVDRLVMILTR